MMDTEEFNEILSLSEKLCTKMSHDLSGASMSVSNSIEMLEDESFKDSATDIAKRGAFSLASKIKFFRLAFGTMGSDLKTEEFFNIINNYLLGVSQKGEFDFEQGLTLNAKETKILFNALIFVVSLLGSKFLIKLCKEDEKIIVKVQNMRVIMLQNDIEVKGNDIFFNEVNSNNSPLYLSKILAKLYGKQLKMNVNENLLNIVIE
ncbi:MAG: hypothetical protein BWY78_00152 [Alphaproteobacteria bacterium ADurb.Bin438]|nr:MAG: hypothetical protein BWY78_00152 [Alphaproteobacteria bacterium ADurb.Bin438]